MLFVGLDDTDNLESRGTGHLARQIALELAHDYTLLGVVRHQLLVDARVPCTRHNSCKALILEADGGIRAAALMERVAAMVLADFQPDSDPGVCVCSSPPDAVVQFGQRAKRELLRQSDARELAARHGILLAGLAGTQDGVIGALAAVGLAASGEDGRYMLLGGIRELSGLQPIGAVLAAGVAAVRTMHGELISDGLVACDKLRPARRGGQAVLFVQPEDDHWTPLKLD